MDAILLAAGRGSRLKPLTDNLPKPLIPIAGRGSLLRTLDALPSSVDRIILVVGYLQEKIRDAVGSEWNGRPVEYLVQEKLDGTGGALRLARPSIRSDRFMILNGDDIYDRDDLDRLSDANRAILVRTKKIHKEMDSWTIENGFVKTLGRTPKDERGSINVGYLLGHEWFDTAPVIVPGTTDEYSIPHAIPQLLDRYPHAAVEANTWIPCGTFEELEVAERACQNA